jgi:hypothetical protein
MWMEYFEFISSGLLFYALLRLAIWAEFHYLPREKSPKNTGEPGTSIDASKLAERVGELREQGYANEVKSTDASKKLLLVEEKRRQLEQMAYFQKPPPAPEPPEHEHKDGLHLMLI